MLKLEDLTDEMEAFSLQEAANLSVLAEEKTRLMREKFNEIFEILNGIDESTQEKKEVKKQIIKDTKVLMFTCHEKLFQEQQAQLDALQNPQKLDVKKMRKE